MTRLSILADRAEPKLTITPDSENGCRRKALVPLLDDSWSSVDERDG